MKNNMFCFHLWFYYLEIFGYDFMIDEELNIWMIEVNKNPCFEF